MVLESGEPFDSGTSIVTQSMTQLGKEAEKLVMRELEREGFRPDQIKEVASERLGYDIEILKASGDSIQVVRRIEVKRRAKGHARFTQREWEAAAEFREGYWLYIVRPVPPFGILKIQDPYGKFAATAKEIIYIQVLLSEALPRANLFESPEV